MKSLPTLLTLLSLAFLCPPARGASENGLCWLRTENSQRMGVVIGPWIVTSHPNDEPVISAECLLGNRRVPINDLLGPRQIADLSTQIESVTPGEISPPGPIQRLAQSRPTTTPGKVDWMQWLGSATDEGNLDYVFRTIDSLQLIALKNPLPSDFVLPGTNEYQKFALFTAVQARSFSTRPQKLHYDGELPSIKYRAGQPMSLVASGIEAAVFHDDARTPHVFASRNKDAKAHPGTVTAYPTPSRRWLVTAIETGTLPHGKGFYWHVDIPTFRLVNWLQTHRADKVGECVVFDPTELTRNSWQPLSPDESDAWRDL